MFSRRRGSSAHRVRTIALTGVRSNDGVDERAFLRLLRATYIAAPALKDISRIQ